MWLNDLFGLSMLEECPVCCENTHSDLMVRCSCGNNACQNCCRQYILSSLHRAGCMKCRTPWNEKFLLTNFTKSWVNNTYRKYRKNVAFEKEKLRLGESMERAKLQKRYNYLRDLYPQMKVLLKTYSEPGPYWRSNYIKMTEIDTTLPPVEDYDELFNVEHVHKFNKHNKCACFIFHGDVYLSTIENERREVKTMLDRGDTKQKSKFSCQCPYDGCRGLVKVETWRCTICEKNVCRRCYEKKEDTHKCDPNIIENIKTIKIDTKPCPKCAVLIHKMYGCDQMWCVKCHTAFNWETLREERGTIHNPHAVQWYRQHPNNTGALLNDLPCGGWIDFENFIERCTRKTKVLNDYKARQHYGRVFERNGFLHMYLYVNYYRYPPISKLEKSLENARVDYIIGKISKEKWCDLIFRYERTEEKRITRNEIMGTLVHLFIERFRNLNEWIHEQTGLTEKDMLVQFKVFMEEMAEIRLFINEALASEIVIGNVKLIPEDWKRQEQKL
jgi:hypothetical protein